MNNDMYFLPIIADAISQPDPKPVISKAFEKIIMLGHQPEYKQGFRQFQMFMSKVEDNWEIDSMTEDEAPYIDFEIIIERNGEHIGSFVFGRSTTTTKRIRNIIPGFYVFKLNTGRTIWQGVLTEQELLWDKAFPERALDLAADTGDSTAQSTREIVLLNGELIIRVFPEIEKGSIEIEIMKSIYE